MSDRVATRCDQCGQTDDHPKAHIGTETRHHDCLSADQKALLTDSAQAAGSGPKASAVIKACEDGARGAELLALIESGELPQAEGIHAKGLDA